MDDYHKEKYSLRINSIQPEKLTSFITFIDPIIQKGKL